MKEDQILHLIGFKLMLHPFFASFIPVKCTTQQGHGAFKEYHIWERSDTFDLCCDNKLNNLK